MLTRLWLFLLPAKESPIFPVVAWWVGWCKGEERTKVSTKYLEAGGNFGAQCSILFNLFHLGGIPGAGGAEVIGRTMHQAPRSDIWTHCFAQNQLNLLPHAKAKKAFFSSFSSSWMFC